MGSRERERRVTGREGRKVEYLEVFVRGFRKEKYFLFPEFANLDEIF